MGIDDLKFVSFSVNKYALSKQKHHHKNLKRLIHPSFALLVHLNLVSGNQTLSQETRPCLRKPDLVSGKIYNFCRTD